jgi:hypothetical protein
VNYYDDAGFAYPQSDRWKTPYGVKGAKRFVAQEGRGLISAPDRRREQLGEEQDRRDYRGLLERDMIGIEPYALWGGRATQDPDVGFQLAPMDVVPAGAGAKALGLLSSIPVGMIGTLGWHGGPHKWAPEASRPLGRPRLDKMGTGEGSQMYGHGFYVGGDRRVGEFYSEELSRGGPTWKYKKASFSDEDPFPSFIERNMLSPDQLEAQVARELDRKFQMGWSAKEAKEVAIDNIKRDTARWPGDKGIKAQNDREIAAINAVDPSQIKHPKSGSLYKMDVPDADIAKMLDWDKPLSEQPENVQRALKAWGNFPDTMKGGEMYEAIASALAKPPFDNSLRSAAQPGAGKAASEFLASKGIPGLKYFDHPESTNMVLWDDDLLKRIKVLERE